MTKRKSPVPAVPAATILLVRDGSSGLEVFTVERHHFEGRVVLVTGAASRSRHPKELAL